MKRFRFTLFAVAIGLCMAACVDERVHINKDDPFEIKESDLDLTDYLPAPLADATPITTFIATKFGGKVKWTNEDRIFQHGKSYQALVTLTALPGFHFPEGEVVAKYVQKRDLSTETGIVEIDTTLTPIFRVIDKDIRQSLIAFPPTKRGNEMPGNEKRPISNDPDLTFRVPTPMQGGTPVFKFTASQYTGEITWNYTDDSDSILTMNPDDPEDKFRIHTAYTAVVTLRPIQGYYFPQDIDPFIHNGGGIIQQSEVTNPDSIGLLINFPVSNATSPTKFSGRTDLENSAINLIRTVARLGVQSSLEFRIVTFATIEQVSFSDLSDLGTGGLILTNNGSGTFDPLLNNSPANVVIDANGLIVDLIGTPNGSPLITVGQGVTLTLRNITLSGLANRNNSETDHVKGNDENNNTAPLIDVKDGGTLILDGGTRLIDNESGNTAGGIRVSGTSSELIMNPGTEISNVAGRGELIPGGVHVGPGSKFTMAGGNILNNKAQDCAGVGINNGQFIMNDGVISGNKSRRESDSDFRGGGGGVRIMGEESQFFMRGGTISDNTSEDVGGGVYIDGGSFTMESGEISDNTATGAEGGGVYINGGSFIMRNGNIHNNTAQSRGGGVFMAGATFDMRAGNIDQNTVLSKDGDGAGVYVGKYSSPIDNRSSTFTMSGGTIRGNAIWPNETAEEAAGNGRGVGVFVDGSSRFEKTRGMIYGLMNFSPSVMDWEVKEYQNYYKWQIDRVTSGDGPHVLEAGNYAGTPGGNDRGYAVYFDFIEGEPLDARWINDTIQEDTSIDTEHSQEGIWQYIDY